MGACVSPDGNRGERLDGLGGTKGTKGDQGDEGWTSRGNVERAGGPTASLLLGNHGAGAMGNEASNPAIRQSYRLAGWAELACGCPIIPNTDDNMVATEVQWATRQVLGT